MKSLALVCFVLLNSFLFGQATEITANYDKIGKFDHGIALVQKNGLVGIINSDGKEIVKPEYERITRFGSDGVAYTHKNGMAGLINRDGKVIVDNVYDRIGHFKNGYAVVMKNGLSGVIDIHGKVVAEVKYQKLSLEDGGMVKATKTDGTIVLLKINQ